MARQPPIMVPRHHDKPALCSPSHIMQVYQSQLRVGSRRSQDMHSKAAEKKITRSLESGHRD
eukprot:4734916-Amphidinium_carterae.1